MHHCIMGARKICGFGAMKYNQRPIMNVFLDDKRITPEGWVRAFWPEEVISLLKSGKVVELSLDHDLGDDDHGTGYTVLLWLEEQVAVNGMRPPIIRVHSANSSARLKMEAAIESIARLADANCASPRNLP